MSDKERAEAAEATLDYVVALNTRHDVDMPPPPPGSAFLIRESVDAGTMGVLLDYRGVEVAVFVEGATAALCAELAERLAFPKDRVVRRRA